MLKKSVDPSHKRILRICLTAKAKKLLEDCNHLMDNVKKELMDGISDSEILKFREVIGKILIATRPAATIPV